MTTRGKSLRWLSPEAQAERDAKIVALRAEGLTQKVIGQRVNLSAQTVGQILKKADAQKDNRDDEANRT